MSLDKSIEEKEIIIDSLYEKIKKMKRNTEDWFLSINLFDSILAELVDLEDIKREAQRLKRVQLKKYNKKYNK